MSENFRKYIHKDHYPLHSSCIKYKAQAKSYIIKTFRKRQWTESEQKGDWDLLWAGKELVQTCLQQKQLKNHQKINHFVNSHELTDEYLRLRNFFSFKEDLELKGKLQAAESFRFFPRTLILPQDNDLFVEESKKANANKTWIIKPIGKVRDVKTFTFLKMNQLSTLLSQSENSVEMPKVGDFMIQEFVDNPFRIGGKKFFVKLFCLVTSFSGQVAYLYRDGLVEFTTSLSDYSENDLILENTTIKMPPEDEKDEIWDLRKLKSFMNSKLGTDKTEECFMDMQQIVVKTINSVQDTIVDNKQCFELFEFKIILDCNLKPWLLKINNELTNPNVDSPVDVELKSNIVDDTLTVIDLEKITTGTEDQIGGFDVLLTGLNNPKKKSIHSSCMLGSINNRPEQLKKLAKEFAVRLSGNKTPVSNPEILRLTSPIGRHTPSRSIPLLNLSPVPSLAEGLTTPKTPGTSIFTSPRSSNQITLPPLPSLTRNKTDPPPSNDSDLNSNTFGIKLKSLESLQKTGSVTSLDNLEQQQDTPVNFESLRGSFTTRNVNLPPIVTRLNRVLRKPKSMSNIEIMQLTMQGLPSSPGSLNEITTPSTGDSVTETSNEQQQQQTQKEKEARDFDLLVLKALHKAGNLEECLKTWKGVKVPVKVKKGDLRKVTLMRNKVKSYGVHLQEIKEEEEMSR